MGAYDNYKVIADNSASDFQNTVASQVSAGFKQLEADKEKRRLIKEKQRKENHRRNSNQIIFNENSAKAINGFNKGFKGIENQVSNSLNASFTSVINEIGKLKIAADNPDTPQDEQTKIQERLVVLNNEVYAIKDEQTNYIGASAAATEKTNDQAGLETSYAYNQLDNQDETVDSGGAAQTIYNQLGGKYVDAKNTIERYDGGMIAKGTYPGEDGPVKYNVKFSTDQWNKFSKKPWYDLLNSETKAVEKISPNIFSGNLMNAKTYENIETETETKTDYGSTTTSEVIIEGDIPTVRTESRQKLNTNYINQQISTEVIDQIADFKGGSSDQQKRALIAIGMDPERLKDLTGSLEETNNFYNDYTRNLTEDVELGLKNANPKFKKDENENWYFLNKFSDETVEAKRKRQKNQVSAVDQKINSEFVGYEQKIEESIKNLVPTGVAGIIPTKFRDANELGNAIKSAFNLGPLKTFRIGTNKVRVSDMSVANGVITVNVGAKRNPDVNALGTAENKKKDFNIKEYKINDPIELTNFINSVTDLGSIKSEEMAEYLTSMMTQN